MIQVTQGAKFSIISVRLQLPEVALSSSTIVCDLDIQFAGQTAHYQHLIFQQVVQGNEHRITGTIPSTLSDFKIPPPSFFTVPLKKRNACEGGYDVASACKSSHPQSPGVV
jgi:hypothetical protein